MRAAAVRQFFGTLPYYRCRIQVTLHPHPPHDRLAFWFVCEKERARENGIYSDCCA